MEDEKISLESGCVASSDQNLEQGANLNLLPWEVVQEIFQKLNGKDLIVCKRVCKIWRDHVHSLEQKKNFWLTNCQKEIPSWTQLELLDNIFPSHWKNQVQVDWEEIYKCWSTWNSAFNAPVTQHELVGGLQGISAIKVSGDWLLISTCEGRGKLCAQRFTDPGSFVDLYVGSGEILNFELVISDNIPYSNVHPPTQLEEIFNTLDHNEIWLELKNSYIRLGKTYRHQVDKIRQRVRHSYGYEVRLVSERDCSSIILKKTCKVGGPELMELELSSPYSQILDFWTNSICLTGQFNKQLVIDAVLVNWRTQEVSLGGSVEYRVENEICQIYSWQGSLFVLYTGKRKIIIYHDGEKEVQVTPIRNGRVTSVLFYANHLFLGTDRGKLLIYYVKSPKECLKISVYETPSWEIDLGYKMIIHIAIAEPVHHKGKGPVILCATPREVYTVSLSL